MKLGYSNTFSAMLCVVHAQVTDSTPYERSELLSAMSRDPNTKSMQQIGHIEE